MWRIGVGQLTSQSADQATDQDVVSGRGDLRWTRPRPVGTAMRPVASCPLPPNDGVKGQEATGSSVRVAGAQDPVEGSDSDPDGVQKKEGQGPEMRNGC